MLSRGTEGLEAPLITVEVHAANGLPSLTLVGLPDAEVAAHDRVRAAILNSGANFPIAGSPSIWPPLIYPKNPAVSTCLLPSASSPPVVNCPPSRLAGYEFAGELSLSGELRPVRGALAMMLQKASGDGRNSSTACRKRRRSQPVWPG